MRGDYQGYSLLNTADRPSNREVVPLLAPSSSLDYPSRENSLKEDPPENGDLDCVQFLHRIVHVHEAHKQAEIQVMRIGSLRGSCTIEYKTQDGTAKADEKYVHTTGQITFEPNEELKPIHVTMLDTSYYDPCLIFNVVLENPSGCILTPKVNSCRIISVDDDIFPDNKYRGPVMRHELESIGLRLLMSFVMFCIRRIPLIRWRTGWILLMDQFHNLSYLISIKLMVYLVDVVLNTKEPESAKHLWLDGNRLGTAVLVALAITLPKAVLALIEYAQIGALGVSGKVKSYLKVNLFRKYLYYSAQSMAKVSPQDLITSLDDDVAELVSLGFMATFQFSQQIVKAGVILYFLCRKRPSSALPLLVYPIAMAIVLNMRYLQTLKLKDDVRKGETAVLNCVKGTCDDISLVKEYNMRLSVSNTFEKVVADAGGPLRKLAEYDFRTLLVMPWITHIAIGLFIILGGRFVLLEQLSLGAFLATINVYRDAGEIFSAFYEHLKNCYAVTGPLLRIVHLMNLQTDSEVLMKQEEDRYKEMLEQLGQTGAQALPSKSRFDSLKIKLKNVSLATDRGGPQLPNLQNVTAVVPQGSMVAVLGAHGTGKYSLLRLLKGSVMPRSGHVHVPPHLRCICVPRVPQIFASGTLLENLVFGLHGDYNKSHLLDICNAVGLSEHWVKTVKEQMHSEEPNGQKKVDRSSLIALRGIEDDALQMRSLVPWHEQMSQSELLKLHIARALHNDPEVLLLQRPVDEMDASHAARILGVFRGVVDNRGFKFTEEASKLARPHTVFWTSGLDREMAEIAADASDIVWRLSEDGFSEEAGGTHRTTRRSADGNQIFKSWSMEAHQAKAESVLKTRELQKEKTQRQETKGLLSNIKHELQSWEKEEEDAWLPVVDRETVQLRIHDLTSLIDENPVGHSLEKPGVELL